MATIIIILSVLTVITAVLAIQGEYKQPRTQLYIFKPATTILIILIAVLGQSQVSLIYKWLIVAGLIFCLGGDVFLMLPPRYFITGLVSFLVGHILYIVAFVTAAGFTLTGWILPLLIYGAVIYGLLHAHLGKMRGPVIAYIIVILLMAWQASGRWTVQGSGSARLAALGAVLFVISDSVLALDRFRQQFKAARIIVLTTYWAAQWLIALSVSGWPVR